jgi:hypothetical protein
MGRLFKTETHTAAYRSIDASHCRLSPTGNSCARRFSAAPVATRVEHRDAAPCASWRIPRLHDPSWTSMSGRSVQDASEDLFGSVCMQKKRQRETVRVANDRARLRKPALRMPEKKKTPGWASEGVRVPRRSGRPISRKRISRNVCRCLSVARACRCRSAARMHPHRGGSATFRTGWRCGGRISWEGSSECVVVRYSTAAMGAHVTPVFFRLQTFFSQTDGRINGAMAGSDKTSRTANENGRPKPPAKAIAIRIFADIDYFGRSTLSITWITPLL